jgi:hypothetical protein
MLIVTYAGFAGESDLLESIYQRGMGGRGDTELECYENDELFLFWSHAPRQPWQTPEYYAQQRKILRPAQFSRLHENQWVSSREPVYRSRDMGSKCFARVKARHYRRSLYRH